MIHHLVVLRTGIGAFVTRWSMLSVPITDQLAHSNRYSYFFLSAARKWSATSSGTSAAPGGARSQCVPHFHVVRRHTLRDRPRRAADAEKPTHHVLPGTDLRERPVPARIEIDLQRLRMRINCFLFHVAPDLAFRP